MARSLAKGGAGLWFWANVALRDRKLATRLSSVLSSAMVELVLGPWPFLKRKSGFRMDSRKTRRVERENERSASAMINENLVV